MGGLLPTRGGCTGFIFGLLRSDIRLSTDDDVFGDDAENIYQIDNNDVCDKKCIRTNVVFEREADKVHCIRKNNK